MSCVLNLFALYFACYRHGQSNPTFLIQTPNKSFVLRKKPPGSLLPGAHKVSVYVLLYLVINSNCLYGFKKRLNLWTLTQVAQVKQKCSQEVLEGDNSIWTSAFHISEHVIQGLGSDIYAPITEWSFVGDSFSFSPC